MSDLSYNLWVAMGRRLMVGIVHCSMLAEDAIKSAISNYYTKNPNAKATDLGSSAAAMPKVEIETVGADIPGPQAATA